MSIWEPVALPRRAEARRAGAAVPSSRGTRRQAGRVALVSMPFRPSFSPSIQVGTLKAVATRSGFEVDTFDLDLDLAALIGHKAFNAFAESSVLGIGDWLFGHVAFGPEDPDPGCTGWVRAPHDFGEVADHAGITLEDLRELRFDSIPRFVADLVAAIDWSSYSVVGFSCTFQQNCASLALAWQLKDRFPEIVTVFGGSNLDGSMGMELVRSSPQIDWGIVGEADRSFPAFLHALDHDADPNDVPGVIARAPDGSVRPPLSADLIRDLDEVPIPDYDDYFERAERLELINREGRRSVWIPFESSRGCWWGERVTCTFCALNHEAIAYRRKSAARTLEEINYLSSRHQSFHLNAVDNIALKDADDGVFPLLAEQGSDYTLFYEVKSDLDQSTFELLGKAGVRTIQPGIESLSSHVLGLMRKGVRAWSNIQLLRSAVASGMKPSWNLLWGFPGELAEDYERQLFAVTGMLHLPPPDYAGPISIERFSPIFEMADRYPMRERRPKDFYEFDYPDRYDREALAFYFEGHVEGTLPPDSEALVATKDLVDRWKKVWRSGEQPMLRVFRGHHLVQIEDTRFPDQSGTHTFKDELATIYLECMNHPRTATDLAKVLPRPVDVQEVQAALDEFERRHLMFKDGNLYLALAVALGGPS